MPKPNLSAHPTEVVKPDDFDLFWQEIMEEVDSIPLNVSIQFDSLRSSKEVEVFEVKYDSLDGLQITGWYCLPGERKIPLPASVFYQVTSVSRPCQNHTLPKVMRPLELRHVANYAAMAHSIPDILDY